MNKMQNITLSLPKDLLQKIKHMAIDKQTSVSGLLTQVLEEIVKRKICTRKQDYIILIY